MIVQVCGSEGGNDGSAKRDLVPCRCGSCVDGDANCVAVMSVYIDAHGIVHVMVVVARDHVSGMVGVGVVAVVGVIVVVLWLVMWMRVLPVMSVDVTGARVNIDERVMTGIAAHDCVVNIVGNCSDG